MMIQTNRLTHLQHAASDGYQRFSKASHEAAEAYLDTGAALTEAKAAGTGGPQNSTPKRGRATDGINQR